MEAERTLERWAEERAEALAHELTDACKMHKQANDDGFVLLVAHEVNADWTAGPLGARRPAVTVLARALMEARRQGIEESQAAAPTDMISQQARALREAREIIIRLDCFLANTDAPLGIAARAWLASQEPAAEHPESVPSEGGEAEHGK